MEEKKSLTVAFTGHRTYEGQAEEDLAILLEELYKRGYRRFLTGMAWGFDLYAAMAVIRLKQVHDDIQLIAIEPYENFRKLFHGNDAALYDKIIAEADEKVVVCKQASKACYFMRNDFLIANASILIAWWNKSAQGGTTYTVKRAKRAALEIHNLYKCESENKPQYLEIPFDW